MKKRFLVVACILMFTVSVIFIVLSYKKNNKIIYTEKDTQIHTATAKDIGNIISASENLAADNEISISENEKKSISATKYTNLENTVDKLIEETNQKGE